MSAWTIIAEAVAALAPLHPDHREALLGTAAPDDGGGDEGE